MGGRISIVSSRCHVWRKTLLWLLEPQVSLSRNSAKKQAMFSGDRRNIVRLLPVQEVGIEDCDYFSAESLSTPDRKYTPSSQ